MSFMNITFEMIYHVVSAYMDAIGILLVPIGMASNGLQGATSGIKKQVV